MSGFLVTTVGQKIYIWQFKDKDLQGIAFIDTSTSSIEEIASSVLQKTGLRRRLLA